jgi:hypothetical protein
MGHDLRAAVAEGERARLHTLQARPRSEPGKRTGCTASDRNRPTCSAGTFELSAGEDPRASAQIAAGAGGEGFVVLPSELRVRNTAGSVADYRVVLSPRIRRVRVVVRDETFRAVTVDVAPAMHRVIALGFTGR